MIYFNVAFTISAFIFIFYIQYANKHIKNLYKSNKELAEELLKVKTRLSDQEWLTSRNTKDLRTLFSLVNVGVDVHVRGGSWAVICIA